ncbi:coiled-coil domain-containing protein 34-like [Thalassophryne amazonica]|uniref:coiled-coil domain-containing protein 34-like n=1 Tax=Thalassophryne amazonica TaxID=390379 RepID=UPI001470D0D1|nr:coiled-coil domain-containing protein 34-like [Thalassophryne amazonica]
MSAKRPPTCPEFSSTPVKSSFGKDVLLNRSFDDGILTEDEDTFSLLSPIYQDSFDSDEDLKSSSDRSSSPRQSDESRPDGSPDRNGRTKTQLNGDDLDTEESSRCELPKRCAEEVVSAASPSLSAWEIWMVNKAKEDILKLEKKAEDSRLLKEKQEQHQRELEEKKLTMEVKIQQWLKMKREQEKLKQVLQQTKEEDEMQKRRMKQREMEAKAQEKYRDWLQKKNQEKIDKEKREKEDAIQKEEQEKERRKKAEEKFKEWLAKTNEKSRLSPRPPSRQTNPYDNFYPSPSFYNPIPWKPIHTPPPEASVNKTSGNKPQKHQKGQQSAYAASRQRNAVIVQHLKQRR